MKKNQIILATLVLFAAVAFTVADSSHRVKVNHKGKVIEVAPEAVAAHLAHGDYLVGDNSSSQAF